MPAYFSAIVRDNNDETKRCRLSLEIPGLTGADVTHPEWVPARLPGGTGPDGVGFVWVPPVGSIVYVEVDDGDTLRWFGGELGDQAGVVGFLDDYYPDAAGFTSTNGKVQVVADNNQGLLLAAGGDSLDARVTATGDMHLTAGTTTNASNVHLTAFGDVRIGAGDDVVLTPGAGDECKLGGAGASNPYLLSTQFFIDLGNVMTDLVAIAAAAGVTPTPGITAMQTAITAGAYKSTTVKGL